MKKTIGTLCFCISLLILGVSVPSQLYAQCDLCLDNCRNTYGTGTNECKTCAEDCWECSDYGKSHGCDSAKKRKKGSTKKTAE